MSISPLSFNVAVLCQMFDLTCLTMEDPPANKTWDCKDIDNYHCGSLDQVFQVGPMTAPAGQCLFYLPVCQCDNGLCVNMTSVYKCGIDGATTTNITHDCNNRKNCITLSGLFYCQVVSDNYRKKSSPNSQKHSERNLSSNT